MSSDFEAPQDSKGQLSLRLTPFPQYDWLRSGHMTKFWPIRHGGGVLGDFRVDGCQLALQQMLGQEDGKNVGAQ